MFSKLRRERVLRAMTQYELEEGTGIHRSLISLIEKGLRTPNPKLRKSLARALKCSESELFSNEK